MTTIVYIDNGTITEEYQVYISNGSGWDQYIANIETGTDALSNWAIYTSISKITPITKGAA